MLTERQMQDADAQARRAAVAVDLLIVVTGQRAAARAAREHPATASA